MKRSGVFSRRRRDRSSHGAIAFLAIAVALAFGGAAPAANASEFFEYVTDTASPTWSGTSQPCESSLRPGNTLSMASIYGDSIIENAIINILDEDSGNRRPSHPNNPDGSEETPKPLPPRPLITDYPTTQIIEHEIPATPTPTRRPAERKPKRDLPN